MQGYTFNTTFGGTLPEFHTENGTDLTLYYCCRQDGDPSGPVSLPSNFPFILFQVTILYSRCANKKKEITVRHPIIFKVNSPFNILQNRELS